MGLLFKTTLIHLKKNSFIVFVLSFFVASGVTVLSSADHLSSNLNKGFQEVNFDSNPHDLILLSKGFKPNQNLKIDPLYENNFANLKLTTRWGYRWSFDSLQDEFWVKKNDYSKVADIKFIENDASSDDDGNLKKLNKSIFSIPPSIENDYSWANVALVCYSKVTFFSTADANLVLLDRHKASFNPEEIINEKDSSVPNTLRKECTDGTTEDYSLFNQLSFFRSVYGYYKDHIAKSNDESKPSENKLNLSADEIAEAHRGMGAFNPKYFWVANNNSDAYPFMNLLEKDFYFTLDSPFKAIMSKVDLAPKFKSLVKQMTDPEIYYKLDDATREQISNFLNSDLFNKLPVKFWISSLGRMSSSIEAWLPMIPGLTYKETTILLMKLVLWKWLSKPEEFNLFNDDLSKYDKTRKEEIKSLIESWTDSEQGIDSWDPFSAIDTNPEQYTKKPETSQKYFFSTLRGSKLISELKESKLKEDVDKTINGKQKTYEDTDTLITAVKKTFLKWIEGDYSKTSNVNNNLILAYNRESHKQKQILTKADSNFDPFDTKKDLYRTQPDNFEEVFVKVANYIKNSVGSYLNSLFATNIKLAKKFINDSEIFTLSFLLQNFKFDPSQAKRGSYRRRNYFWSQQGEDKDFNITIPKLTSHSLDTKQSDYSPSINYHKSLVIANSNKQSAKLNDDKKTAHSFKVISQERKDNAYVNRIKIISGNPLIEAKYDYFTVLNALKKNKYEYRDFFKALKKLKYQNPVHTEVVEKYANYFLNKFDDRWTDEKWFSYSDERNWKNIFKFFKEKKNSSSRQGNRVTVMIPAEELINFTRTLPIRSILTTIPTAGYIDQFTSNFAIISPFYAQQNNIKPISNEKYEWFKKLVNDDNTTQEKWEKEFAAFILNPANHESIININGNKLIVVGTGMSPDMLLPSHSYINLVPNKSKEALVFVDKYGYANIKNNSLSNWDEYYLSLSFPQIVKEQGIEYSYQKQISDYISYFLNNQTVDLIPENNKDFELRLVKGAPLTQLVYLRSQYVDKFLLATHSMFSLILVFMGVVILFTVWVLIKKYITSSLNTFGVFVANGIYRRKIMFQSSVFVLLPTLVGVVVGYLISLALQPVIFGLISSIWYLTPVFSGFSISSLLYYALIATGILTPISLVSSYLMLKSDVSTLMKVNVAFKHNKITQWIYKYFNNVSSLWKFRVSVILNTVGRGLILSSATVFLFVFTSFLFNNFNQFKNVSKHEIGSKDYGFSLAFETPTEQSGQPGLVSYTNLGDTYLDKRVHKKDAVVQTSKGHWDLESVEFDENNPEIIGSGLKNIYPVGDIKEYLDTCNTSLSMQQWYEKLGFMDFNYPGNTLEFNPYNSYLFANSLTRKTDGAAIDCSRPILDFYDRANFDFIVPETSDLSLFYSSNRKLNQKEVGAVVDPNSRIKTFRPDTTSANKISALGEYIPIENENRIKNGSNQVNGKNEKPWQMPMYGNEPLFKPLIDYYANKQPLINKNSYDTSPSSYTFLKPETFNTQETTLNANDPVVKLKGDFITSGENGKQPTLQRLFKDHSNYWLFAYHDLHSIRTNPQFLKNRVLMPILFNHDWTFTMFGAMITFNPWQEFSEFFAKYSTELVASMESNYSNFINEIIKSRYGEYFVNRFMDKHAALEVNPNHSPGKHYWGKPTWKVSTDMLQGPNKGLVDEGLYFINPDKLVYFYEKLRAVEGAKEAATDTASKHPERFVVFRPDFLYLVYALIKDKDFLTDAKAPMKVTFHQNIYVPDYANKYEEWQIDGNPLIDALKNKGLTASDPSIKTKDYDQTPFGDQSYTYLVVSIPNISQTQEIIGLKQDRRGTYVKLRKDGELVNFKLYRDKFGDGSYPVIINQFTAKNLNLSIDSKIEVVVHNTTDRFTKQMKGVAEGKKVTLRVIDIYDSYYKNAFYISQKNANEIIGLDPEYGYGGIYTKKLTNIDDLPLQFVKAISGYSPSGIYSRQKVSKFSSEFTEFLNGTPSNMATSKYDPKIKFLQPQNSTWLKLKLGLKDVSSIEGTEDIADVLDRVFGGSYALSPSIVHIENANLFNDFVFNTVSDLVISVINLFIAIFSPLLVFALLVITNLIIEDLKNLLTILNLLGFTYAENSATILLYLGLVLIFSTIVALPLSSVLLSLYVEGIFSTLSIYLPIYLRFDYVLLSFVVLTSMFAFSYWKSRRKIKSLYLPIAMKSLNE